MRLVGGVKYPTNHQIVIQIIVFILAKQTTGKHANYTRQIRMGEFALEKVNR